MKKKINPLFYFIPFLHICLICLFIFFQWRVEFLSFFYGGEPKTKTEKVKPVKEKSQKPQTKAPKEQPQKVEMPEVAPIAFDDIEGKTKKGTFKKSVKNIEVSSKKKVKESNGKVKVDSAVVNCNGIIFSFESKKDIVWQSEQGKISQLSLKGIVYSKKDIALVLSNDTKIVFTAGEEDEIAISAIGNQKGLIFVRAFDKAGGELVGEVGGAIFSNGAKRKQTILTQSSYSGTFKALALAVNNKVTVGATVNSLPEGEAVNAVVSRYSESQYSQLFFQFRQGAYDGFAVDRYNRATGLWSNEEGGEGVSANLVDYFVAEAYNRGEPNRALAWVTDNKFFNYDLVNSQYYENRFINPEVASFSTALIYGEVKSAYDKEKAIAEQNIAAIYEASKNGNYDFLNNPRLTEQVLFFGTPADKNAFVSLLSKPDEIEGVKNLVGASANCLQLLRLFPEQNQTLSQILQKLLDRLSLFVSFNNRGAWICENNLISLEHTFVAATAFDGATTFDNKYRKIATTLLSSYISRVNTISVAPKNIDFATNIETSNAKLLPENLYPWVKTLICGSNLVRFQSKNSGDIFVWHRSRALDVREDGGFLSLNFTHWHQAGSNQYAVGVLNCFLVKGVKPYTRTMMWGTSNWPTDTTFETWRLGYNYWQNEELAAVMLRHRSGNETFTFVWE